MLAHYNFSSHPFHEKIDLENIYIDYRLKKALKMCTNLFDMGGSALLSGRSGLGKTLVLRLLQKQIADDQKYRSLYLNIPESPSCGVLRIIVNSLGEQAMGSKDRLFQQTVLLIKEMNMPLYLIFDEAHLLSKESLLDIRLLISSLEQTSSLRVLFCGQPYIHDTLKTERMTDLRERMPLSFNLEPFDEVGVEQYMKSRLEFSKRDLSVFSKGLLKNISVYSGGVPRRINNICTACLIQGEELGKDVIDEELFYSIKGDFIK